MRWLIISLLSLLLDIWIGLGQPKVVLRVGSEAEMKNLVKFADEKNIVHGLVRDAGRTEVKSGTITVLGIGPDTVGNVDELTKHLKLL